MHSSQGMSFPRTEPDAHLAWDLSGDHDPRASCSCRTPASEPNSQGQVWAVQLGDAVGGEAEATLLFPSEREAVTGLHTLQSRSQASLREGEGLLQPWEERLSGPQALLESAFPVQEPPAAPGRLGCGIRKCPQQPSSQVTPSPPGPRVLRFLGREMWSCAGTWVEGKPALHLTPHAGWRPTGTSAHAQMPTQTQNAHTCTDAHTTYT